MSTPPPPKRQWSWRSQAFRGLIYQIIALAALTTAIGLATTVALRAANDA